jgi:hypothetical protein
VKLVISRHREDLRGPLRVYKGSVFTLFYSLKLSNDEANLAKEYKLDDYMLTVTDTHGGVLPWRTVRSLRQGSFVTTADAVQMDRYETGIKRACDQVSLLIDRYRSSDKELDIEYPRTQNEE